MSFQLPVPFLTEPDPDRVGEGSLDPLGLASIADRLADQIAPGVTARMSRIRFLTAIAAGATIAEELGGEVAVDGRTPAYLAYEWVVVEAMARRRIPSETQGVPGIRKARRVVERTSSGHLDSGSYLQVPKVFGFYGVYKPLARGMGLIDKELLPLGRGDALLRIWEREQGLLGFADRTPGSRGGKLARKLLREVQGALAAGRVATARGSHLWRHISDALGPDEAGRRERKFLWEGLIDESQSVRSELVLALRGFAKTDLTEAEMLRAIHPRASTQLRARLSAIDAYEGVAGLLTGVLRAMQFMSTMQGSRPVLSSQLTSHESVMRASKELPGATRLAADWLSGLGEEQRFEDAFGQFAEPLDPAALIEAVLARHERVQDEKGGKRPWLERTGGGFFVRVAYRTNEDRLDARKYVHPYRVEALTSFIRDLGMAE